MTNLTLGQKVFIFQPETPDVKRHWVETTITYFLSDCSFETADAVIILIGSEHWSAWSEHCYEEQDKTWSLEVPSISLEEQEKLFWSTFD